MKDFNLKASFIIGVYMKQHRHYLYKDNWDFWDSNRYHTENPDENVKVIDDYEIDCLEYGDFFVDAYIYEDLKTNNWFKVKIKITIDGEKYNEENKYIGLWDNKVVGLEDLLSVEIVETKNVSEQIINVLKGV